ncbi:hypothetical protein ACROYT_G015386 [Oculina patagonica]
MRVKFDLCWFSALVVTSWSGKKDKRKPDSLNGLCRNNPPEQGLLLKYFRFCTLVPSLYGLNTRSDWGMLITNSFKRNLPIRVKVQRPCDQLQIRNKY